MEDLLEGIGEFIFDFFGEVILEMVLEPVLHVLAFIGKKMLVPFLTILALGAAAAVALVVFL